MGCLTLHHYALLHNHLPLHGLLPGVTALYWWAYMLIFNEATSTWLAVMVTPYNVLIAHTDDCLVQDWSILLPPLYAAHISSRDFSVYVVGYSVEQLLIWFENVIVLACYTRPVGRGGGSRGFERTPFLASRRFIYTALTVHLKCPTVGRWSTSSLTAI